MAIKGQETTINYIGTGLAQIEPASTGILVLILEDDTNTTFTKRKYYSFLDVNEADYTAENLELISMVFKHKTQNLIVLRAATTSTGTDWSTLIEDELITDDYNVIAGVTTEATKVAVLEGVPALEKQDNRYVTAVTCSAVISDDYDIVNIDANLSNVKFNEDVYPSLGASLRGREYIVPAIAGLIAGVPYSQSVTFKEIVGVEKIDNLLRGTALDTRIDEGWLTLIRQNKAIKIARGVNSLQTLSDTVTEDFKYIKIVNIQNFASQSISKTFKDEYVGNYSNTIANKNLFLAAIDAFFLRMEALNYLEPAYDNRAEIDIQKHRELIIGDGLNPNDLSIDEVKAYNTGTYVYSIAYVSIPNAMEDLIFNIYMA